MKVRKEPRKRRHSIRNKILVVILGIVLVQGIISMFPQLLIRESFFLVGQPQTAIKAGLRPMEKEKHSWKGVYEVNDKSSSDEGNQYFFVQVKSFGPLRYVTAFTPM